jgi:hypothetical protein
MCSTDADFNSIEYLMYLIQRHFQPLEDYNKNSLLNLKLESLTLL